MHSRNGATFQRIRGNRAGIPAMEYALLTATFLGALITAITTHGAQIVPLLTDYAGCIGLPVP